MTDSEVLKALEYCNADRNECDKCALQEECESNPFYSTIAKYALDLIKRQKKELEDIKDKKAIVFKLSEEQLSEVNENLLKLVEYNERKIKAEAYKEFADRIRQVIVLNNTHDGYLVHDIDYNCLMEDIDDVLKEMVGEEE